MNLNFAFGQFFQKYLIKMMFWGYFLCVGNIEGTYKQHQHIL